jgi:hypothetical protein
MEEFEIKVRNRQPVTKLDIENAFKDNLNEKVIYTSAVYNTTLLIKLLDIKKLDLAELPSMIARCVEYNLLASLNILLFSRKYKLNFIPAKSRCLYLRKISSIKTYLIARKAGWVDVEWEKRIIFIQRLFRARKFSQIKFTNNFSGPFIADYKDEYFSYRHGLYNVRWNRNKRWKFYLDIITDERWGDCVWQSYVDFVENKVDIPRNDNHLVKSMIEGIDEMKLW